MYSRRIQTVKINEFLDGIQKKPLIFFKKFVFYNLIWILFDGIS